MKLLSLLFLTILSLPVIYCQTTNRGAAVTSTKSSGGNTYAIILGVSEYSNLTPEQQLNYADSDAVMITSYLESWENVDLKIFLNKDASPRDRIGMEIENTLMKKAKAGDKVIIFFAGHGDLDENYGEGYLLLNQVKPPNEASYKWNDALPLTNLKESINKAGLNGVEVFLIADACHSGAVLNSSSNSMMSGINDNSIRMISCKKGQTSQEDPLIGHGFFTYYLINGMTGLADEDNSKTISLFELKTYVEKNVREKTAGSQQPVFESTDDNIIISNVNEELLAIAKKDKKSTSLVASNGKKRSLSDPYKDFSTKCLALMRLLDEQTAAKKFFTNELDSLDQQTIVIGKTQSKKNHAKPVSTIALSPDGKFMASASEDGIAVYKNQDLKNPIWIEGQTGKVTCLDYSPSGKILASGTFENSVILWNVADGKVIKTMPKFSKEVTSLKYINENLIAVGTISGIVYLWDLLMDKKITVKAHKGSVSDIELNYPLMYTAGNDGKISVFDLDKMKNISSFNAHDGGVNSIKLLAGSNKLLSIGVDEKLKKWDLGSNKLMNDLDFDYSDLNDIDVDPFESYCFIGSKQKKVAIVNLANFQLMKTKSSGTSGITNLLYDPIHYSLMMGEYDGSVSALTVKVQPENTAAIDLIDQLSDCSNDEQKEDFDRILLMSLNASVSNVLNSLVNGSVNAPDSLQIKQAILHAEKALEIGKELNYDIQNLEINVKLLEVYSVIALNENEKFTEAIENLKEIEELDPKGAYVYNVSALLHVKMNDMTTAKKMAEKAEELAPKWSEATNNAGKVLLLAGDMKGAEIKFTDAVKKSPQLSKGYASLGELYLIQGKLEDARFNLEKAIKIDSSVVATKEMYAEIMRRQGKQKVNPTVKKLALGDEYKGGIIIYIDAKGEHGIVCSSYNLGKHSWSNAYSICNDLTLGNYSDWRLPTMAELTKCSQIGNQLNGFENAPLWTSTEVDSNTAFWKRLSDGVSDKTQKSNVRIVLAVRTF